MDHLTSFFSLFVNSHPNSEKSGFHHPPPICLCSFPTSIYSSFRTVNLSHPVRELHQWTYIACVKSFLMKLWIPLLSKLHIQHLLPLSLQWICFTHSHSFHFFLESHEFYILFCNLFMSRCILCAVKSSGSR